jgi:hypothetical protein
MRAYAMHRRGTVLGMSSWRSFQPRCATARHLGCTAALYIFSTVMAGVHCTSTRSYHMQGYATEAGSDDWGASKRALLAFARSDDLLPAIGIDSIKALVASDIQYMDRKVSCFAPLYCAAQFLSCCSPHMSRMSQPDECAGTKCSPAAEPAGWQHAHGHWHRRAIVSGCRAAADGHTPGRRRQNSRYCTHASECSTYLACFWTALPR